MATNEKFQRHLQEAVKVEYDKKVKAVTARHPKKDHINKLRLYGLGFGGKLPRVKKKTTIDAT